MKNTDLRSIGVIIIIILIGGGIAWAGSQGGYIVFGVPIFALCVGLAFVLNWIAFIPAFTKQTEKFFDLMGSITYLSVTWIAVLLIPVKDARAWLLLALVSIWAIRLGTFLFRRVQAVGEDRRFRDLKPSFWRFLSVWTIQGLWVSFTIAAGLAAITTTVRRELGVFALVGTLLWLIGFSIEVIADRQKDKFRTDPQNEGKFINSGLWSWSRHPNYFGEILLWIGVAVIAVPVLSGWQWLTMISPIFVIVLLTRISGIPMLERRADEKWGGQDDYEQYKSRTSILIPWPPTSSD
jgi:steroid 5-alpha reductase family enzyme